MGLAIDPILQFPCASPSSRLRFCIVCDFSIELRLRLCSAERQLESLGRMKFVSGANCCMISPSVWQRSRGPKVEIRG